MEYSPKVSWPLAALMATERRMDGFMPSGLNFFKRTLILRKKNKGRDQPTVCNEW